MYTKTNIKNLITYYNSFASDKEKYYFDKILRKPKPSAWDKQFLDTLIRRMKVRYNTISTLVDSRLKAIKNNPNIVSVLDTGYEELSSSNKSKSKKTLFIDSKGNKRYI